MRIDRSASSQFGGQFVGLRATLLFLLERTTDILFGRQKRVKKEKIESTEFSRTVFRVFSGILKVFAGFRDVPHRIHHGIKSRQDGGSGGSIRVAVRPENWVLSRFENAPVSLPLNRATGSKAFAKKLIADDTRYSCRDRLLSRFRTAPRFRCQIRWADSGARCSRRRQPTRMWKGDYRVLLCSA